MEIQKEINELAANFEACQKTLSAIGDETRQHIILEMMRMDYNGSRVIEITRLLQNTLKSYPQNQV